MSASALHAAQSPFGRFRFDRWPLVTLFGVLLIVGVYIFWQGGLPGTADDLNRQGAKNLSLMLERGEWWRLLSANLLHASFLHMALNALFLFNLGGPAETVFRRVDYALLLVLSALGTTIVSSAIGSDTSCGASGMIFGVWAALAVFGLRFRSELPVRYQRYFLGSVLPYAAIAFYLGVKTPGADFWGHLGGLLTGASLGLVLQPRLLASKPRHQRVSALALVGVGSLIAALSLFFPRTVSPMREVMLGDLTIPVPARWRQDVERHEPRRQTASFRNGAGVSFTATAQLLDQPQDLSQAAEDLLDELSLSLGHDGVQDARVVEHTTREINGMPAEQILVDTASDTFLARATFLVLILDNREYVLSLSAPLWLYDVYAPVLDLILDGVKRRPAP